MAAMVRTADGAADTAAAGDNVNILLVDDRPENLLALAALLEAPGRTLVGAESGRDALRELLQREFVVILLDVNMPLMDGFETAALIRQRPALANTPIIFVTAHDDEGHLQRAYGLGAVDYVLAPVNPEVLTAKVSVFVDLYRKTAENRRQAEQLRRAEAQLRRQAEERLRETHAQLQQIIESVADYAIFSLDPDARIATWNGGAERLFLYDEAEAVGRPIDLLLPPDGQEVHREARQRALADATGEVDTWFARKDGSRFYGTGLVTAMRNARGDLMGFSNVTRDVTERRRAEEALQRQADELAQANRVKDEFLAVLSHELRTPLNAILGWSRMLADGRLGEDVSRRGLEAIARNAEAQLALVNDILDVSRFVTGKLRLDVASLDVRLLVHAAVETGRAAARAKRIELETALPPEPVVVNGDTARLQQVIWNLVSNAVKFTRDGGRVRLAIDADDRNVFVRVSDNGIGIAPEFLPFVFDRFRQADSSIARTAGGLGLGLAIVRHIVEMHGGTVEASSDGPGHGATFTVTLPAAGQPTAPPLSAASEGAPAVTSLVENAFGAPDTAATFARETTHPPLDSLAGVRCLLVDDDPDSRFLMRTALEKYGAQVTVAASAQEAAERIGEAEIVLADLAMPGEDGYSLIRRVRGRAASDGGAIPAIAVTACAAEGDRTRALEAGFQAHLAKPFDIEQVIAAIQRVLKESRSRSSLL